MPEKRKKKTEGQPNGNYSILATNEWMCDEIYCTTIFNLQFPARNIPMWSFLLRTDFTGN
jgi:hypothetical protein